MFSAAVTPGSVVVSHSSPSDGPDDRLQLLCVRDHEEARVQLDRIADRTFGEGMRRNEALVSEILEQVRSGGDGALLSLSEKFDGVRPDPLQISEQRIERAWQECPETLRRALALAHQRIEAFHQRQYPEDLRMAGPHGETLGRRWRPVACAGLYVPGGRAAYPSTVLMNAVPAKVAGVNRLVMVTPPGPEGEPNATVLAAAHLAGIREVYRVGVPRRLGPLPGVLNLFQK